MWCSTWCRRWGMEWMTWRWSKEGGCDDGGETYVVQDDASWFGRGGWEDRPGCFDFLAVGRVLESTGGGEGVMGNAIALGVAVWTFGVACGIAVTIIWIERRRGI